VNRDLHFDYTTIGHVTVDVLDDGSRRAGGTAFYSALQAARLGLRALIVTRGVPGEIEALLAPHRGELALTVMPAAQTTTLRTLGSGSERGQRVLAWAGPILTEELPPLDTAILHLAPVARETPGGWPGRVRPRAGTPPREAVPSRERVPFVGLTPQGLVRDWSAPGGEIVRVPPTGAAADAADAVAGECDAIVVNEHERASCAGMIAAACDGGAIVAVTAGASPITILAPSAAASGLRTDDLELDVPRLERPVDDLGAGDVFAAAFFVALSEGRSPLDAAAFANAAAAVRMCGVGADAIGGREEVETRLHATAGATD
jgi:1D-myo-inositol 3-kinase